MNYPIPANSQEVLDLRQKAISEELIASAIAGVVQLARSNGQSLDEVVNEILQDDALLDLKQRHWLSEVVTVAWQEFS